MLRLVIALALTLGAGTQPIDAFVVAPQHRLVLSPCARGCNSVPGRQAVPLPLSDREGSAWSYAREGRGYGYGRSKTANVDVSMRAGSGRAGRGRRVEIEGSGGEKRRVQRRSREPDLRSVRRIGLQAAAAVVVQQEEGVDVQTSEDQESRDAQGSMTQSLADQYEAGQGLREREMMAEEQSGTVLDKYTQIYIPMDGIVIKKTYGFWTWQVFGLIFIQHFVRNIIRKGGSLKKTSMSELNWDHIVTEPEHLLELKAYCCEECGYTLFPARGRHEVFFDEVEDFECPECGAPRSAFYDANDKDDPHNQKANEELESMEGATGADDKGGGEDDDNVGGVVTSAAAAAPSSAAGAKSPSATTTTAPASPSAPAPASSSTNNAPPESESSKAGESSPPADNKRPDGDGDDDDLLDF